MLDGQLQSHLVRIYVTGLLTPESRPLDGALWDVPIELVALMGISQAGYVLPKFDTLVMPAKEATDAGNRT